MNADPSALQNGRGQPRLLSRECRVLALNGASEARIVRSTSSPLADIRQRRVNVGRDHGNTADSHNARADATGHTARADAARSHSPSTPSVAFQGHRSASRRRLSSVKTSSLFVDWGAQPSDRTDAQKTAKQGYPMSLANEGPCCSCPPSRFSPRTRYESTIRSQSLR
jgi:hypothetical protein